jgi:hypothetical protein
MGLSDQNLRKIAEEDWISKIIPNFVERCCMGRRMLW